MLLMAANFNQKRLVVSKVVTQQHLIFFVVFSPKILSFQANLNRRIRPEVFCSKGVLKNFAKFTGKHLCQSLFLNEVAGLMPATLLKKGL